MELFGRAAEPALGFIIDIGSGSVLVAIVRSDSAQKAPDIIWSHREHVPLRTNAAHLQSAKNINTALLNAAILLETTGRKVLDQALPNHREPATLQVTIAAPWSYTVTTSISYVKDEPFVVSEDLLQELERAAQQKIDLELKENEVMSELGLQVIARSTIETVANGYSFTKANNQKAVSLQISRVGAIAQRHLTEAIAEIQDKSFPKTRLYQSSFMLCYHQVTRDLYRSINEYCLVDITYEATEIGIVRDGVLRYCTHIPYGAYSLARDIAELRKTPLEEAYGRLTSAAFLTPEGESVEGKFEALYRNYEQKLAELLHETGDNLSIPKTLIVHCSMETEAFFKERIAAAAALATYGTHVVLLASSDLASAYYGEEQKKNVTVRNDTAMVITAQFFHTHRQDPSFEWQ